jgi:hypothetical protein
MQNVHARRFEATPNLEQCPIESHMAVLAEVNTNIHAGNTLPESSEYPENEVRHSLLFCFRPDCPMCQYPPCPCVIDPLTHIATRFQQPN